VKFIRKILVRLLGLKGYLQLVSRIYIRLIRFGFFKTKHSELHFIGQIVQPGAAVLDIGANLGYYSFFMAKYLEGNGSLIAVEPIPLFAEIWKKNLATFNQKNIWLFNCALGQEARSEVTMTIPVVDGVVRHGLTRIDEQANTIHSNLSFMVPMRNGDELIKAAGLDRLDFVKCDVEGYEQFVMPSLRETLSTLKPMIQIELSGNENRTTVFNFLTKLGYRAYVLKDFKLFAIEKSDIFTHPRDFYFIHPDGASWQSKLLGNSK